jgi:hypothetical protein
MPGSRAVAPANRLDSAVGGGDAVGCRVELAHRRIFDERFAWAWLAAAMVISVALVLRFGRETTFGLDELSLFMQSPNLDLTGALHPHDGHLVLVVRLVNKAVLEVFGTSYLTFRLLGVAALLLMVSLLFAYLKRRVPPYVALAPCLVLLVFGSDSLHVLTGNAFGVLLAVSCGVAALMALERDDLKGDIAACSLLLLGILTYSITLAFIAGAGIAILLSRRRWRRLWIVAIPIALYGAWSLWAASYFSSPGNQAHLSHIVLLPSWGAQSLSAVLGALSGLDYPFAANSAAFRIGPALALVAMIFVGLRLKPGRTPASLWAALAVLVAAWGIGVLTGGENRAPSSPRFLFPGAVITLLVLGGCAAGLRWRGKALIAVYLLAASGFAANVFILHDEGARLRSYSAEVKADYAGLDIAGSHMQETFYPAPPPNWKSPIPGGPLSFVFGSVTEAGLEPPAAYRAAVNSYGPLGYSVEEVRAAEDPVRAQTDAALVGALGLAPHTTAHIAANSTCRVVQSSQGNHVETKLPAGGAVLESATNAPLEVRRFADNLWWLEIGSLEAEQPAVLRIPRDHLPDPWWVSVPTTSLRVCRLR